MRGQLTASSEERVRVLGLPIPHFAVGTNRVPRAMLAALAMVHKCEVIVPATYNPSSEVKGIGGAAWVRGWPCAVEDALLPPGSRLVCIASI